MRILPLSLLLASVLTLAPMTSLAGGQGWSALSARGAGSGNTLLHVEAGFPAAPALTLLYGADDRLSVGGRFSLNYALEGLIDAWRPGIGTRFQGLLHYGLLDRDRFNMELRFEPGVAPYFDRGDTDVALLLPLGLNFGFPVSAAVNLNASFDMPLWLWFDENFVSMNVPILFGGGVEYFIDQNLALTFNLKMGPTITPFWSAFTFQSMAGVAFKL